jgi:hypothetical protein
VGSALEKGLDLRRTGRLRFRELFPGASLVPDGPLFPSACGPRLRGVLDRAGWARWSVLLDQRAGDVAALANVGKRALIELIAMCFQRSVEGVAEAWASEPGTGDLAVVLRHERGDNPQPLLEALLEQWSGDGPASVRDAAGRLIEANAPWVFAETVTSLLGSIGDERSRRLFVAWSLRPDGRPLEQLARQGGTSGQALRRAESCVREALTAGPAHLRWLVGAAGRRLGTVATGTVVFDTLARLGASEPEAGELVLWLAGPYRPVKGCDGWLARDRSFTR